MITEIKTKKQIVVDIATQSKEFVYLQVANVVLSGTGFSALIEYVTKDSNGKINTLITTRSEFTEAEADALHQALSVSGSTFSDEYKDLIAKATMYEAGQKGLFGLTSADFEAVE